MLRRNYIGIELDPNYHAIAQERLEGARFPARRPEQISHPHP
jgi:DNA modification methylase